MAREDGLSSSVRFSVVIPVHDDAELLRPCLRSIFTHTSDDRTFEVIVVDDGSSDRPEVVTASFPVRLVRSESCRGAGAARNLGVRHAVGEVVLFTDADCEVSVGWADRLGRALAQAHEADPEVMALSAKVDSDDGWVAKAHAYAGYAYVQGGPTHDTASFNTANAAIFRSVFDQLGGFEETFAAHEDHDFGLRLVAAGHRTRFEPTVDVYHHHGIHTFAQMIDKHYRWGRAAGLRIERRHPERLGRFLAVLENPISHFLVMVPLAVLGVLKIVRHLLPVDPGVVLYVPTILAAKLAFRWAIFRHPAAVGMRS